MSNEKVIYEEAGLPSKEKGKKSGKKRKTKIPATPTVKK